MTGNYIEQYVREVWKTLSNVIILCDDNIHEQLGNVVRMLSGVYLFEENQMSRFFEGITERLLEEVDDIENDEFIVAVTANMSKLMVHALIHDLLMEAAYVDFLKQVRKGVEI